MLEFWVGVLLKVLSIAVSWTIVVVAFLRGLSWYRRQRDNYDALTLSEYDQEMSYGDIEEQ